ncbi:hypothetical protein AXG93_4541s1020 [Marchantia polymorpha subsp. ruderalis]|uniref:Uncharacterized protein n=1 Tax=Marchantia polymorpha subsp. ruderalis TaxID=1480154 RepID=A0A176VT63_MARPO|nr:hypothetical protein AXG93_4541s1020 [Marchantia polymorpha subsp. ruderalis]
MSKSTKLRMVPLKLPQIGLRAFQDRLIAVKLDFLLWGWNYVCPDMVREWQRERHQPTRGFRPHVDRWTVHDWGQVLGRCAGEDGFLLFDSESVKVSKAEEASFVELFKREKSTKNGYRTRDYRDRFRRNVAMALLQLLQPHRTTYITSWQVSFVELTLAGAPVHWSRILHRVTRQHAFEERGGTINHLSPFLINFYRSMGCLTATERIQFPPLSLDNPGRTPKRCARLKKKVNRKVVVSESLEGNVAMNEGAASTTDEDTRKEPSERKQSSLEKDEKKNVPEPKTSEEHAKELTLNEEILEYVVKLIGGTMVKSLEISLPQASEGVMRPEAEKRSLKEEPKELIKKQEAKLTSWATKLTKCETAKSSKVECRVKLDADRDRLRDQLKAVTE